MRNKVLITTLVTSLSLCISNGVKAEQQKIIFGKVISQNTQTKKVTQNPEQPPTNTPNPNETTPTQREPRVLVGEVAVTGVENGSKLQEIVYDAIRTKPGRVSTQSQIQEDINAIYATGLFSLVNVKPEDTPLGVRVNFMVTANPILKQVKVEGVEGRKNAIPQGEVDKIFQDKYGQILNYNDIREGAKQLNKWYKDNGYDLAKIIDIPKPKEDGIVSLIIAEGVIEDIQVRFLNKDREEDDDKGQKIKGRTRQFVITRELQMKPGDVFNRQQAQKDLRRVFGLGLFEDINLSFKPGDDPSKIKMSIDVIEKNSGSVSAGAGLSSANGLFGSISYQEQNLGGTNKKFGTELQLGEREFLFDVSFTDPWIGGDSSRTSYTINGFRRRTISQVFDSGKNIVNLDNNDRARVLRLGGGITFSRPIGKDPFERAEWIASLGFQYQRVSIRDRDGNLRFIDQKGNNLSFSGTGIDDLFTVQFGAVRDRRNDPLKTTSGSLFRLGLEQSIPLGEGNIFLSRLRGSYSYFVPVNYLKFKGPQTLAFNIQAGTVFGDLPPYEAFVTGGSNSVRGFEEGSVAASRSFVQATAEYRFPLFSILGGALFVDAASDLGTSKDVPGNPSAVRGKPGAGLGYGLGVRVQSPLGPLRLDYGLNDQGDSRLHFGIGERF
ncbi:MAG TPA: BamA/TamA family outer membrane protein [Allocoleopsis sp.]